MLKKCNYVLKHITEKIINNNKSDISKFIYKKNIKYKSVNTEKVFNINNIKTDIKNKYNNLRQEHIDILSKIISGRSGNYFNHKNKNDVIDLFDNLDIKLLNTNDIIIILKFLGNSVFRKLDFNNSSKYYTVFRDEFITRNYYNDIENYLNDNDSDYNESIKNKCLVLIDMSVELGNLNIIDNNLLSILERLITKISNDDNFKDYFETEIFHKLSNILWVYWKLKQNSETLYELYKKHTFNNINKLNEQKILQSIWIFVCCYNNTITENELELLFTKYFEKNDNKLFINYNHKNCNIYIQIMLELYPNDVNNYIITNRFKIESNFLSKLQTNLIKLFNYSMFIIENNFKNNLNNKHLNYIEELAYNYNNLIIIKNPLLTNKSFHEDNFGKYINRLNKKIEMNKTILFYQIDFLIDGKYVIELNGNVHFLKDISDNNYYYKNINNNNYELKCSQLKRLGIKRIIPLTINEWKKILDTSATEDEILLKIDKLIK